MTWVIDQDDGRHKLIPRSPKRKARSPSPIIAKQRELIPQSPKQRARSQSPTIASTWTVCNASLRSGSLESTFTETTGSCTPALTPDGASTRTIPERANRLFTLEREVEDLSLSSSTPEQLSQSPIFDARPRSARYGTPEKNEIAATKASPPSEPRISVSRVPDEPPEEERQQSIPSLSLSPPPSEPSTIPLESADIPLPTVEPEDPVITSGISATPRAALLAKCETVESDFDDRSATHSPEVETSGRESNDRHISLASGIADLSLSSPTSGSLLTTRHGSELSTSNKGTRDQVTVRDLPNATPRPSPAPEPAPLSANNVPQSGLVELEDPHLLESSEESTDSETYSDNEELRFDYDVSKEKLPASPFANQRFQDALKGGVDLVKTISRCLDDCQLAIQNGTELHRLHQTAKRLHEFNSPAKRRIGIVGDSGVGKSSLINSLLAMPELAHRGDTGFAVTSFVTEYRKREAYQTAAFTIRVNCSRKDHIEEQINDLLYDFRAPHEPGILARLSLDSDEFRELERKSEVAFSTIDSLLGKYGVITRGFLLDTSIWDTNTSKGSVEDIKTYLHEIAEDIDWPQGTQGGQWEETATTAKNCRQKVAQFMENGFWPLIDTVKIYLSAQILKTGIILVDLPGLRDINLARVRKTERYQHKCDEIFITANIKRVGSDESVKRLISERVFESPKVDLGVSIICTHADDINVADSEVDKSLKPFINEAERKLAKRTMTNAKRSNQSDIFEHKKLIYDHIFINARNQMPRQKALEKYGALAGQTQLRVFCVGNKNYEGNNIFYPEGRKFAKLKSGIPELRAFCHSVVAKAQFGESTHYLETEIPELVQSLKLWTETAEEDSRRGFLPPGLIPRLQTRLMDEVDVFSDAVADDLKTRILQLWEGHRASFDRCATEASIDWTTLAWNQYKAFARNNGTYATQKLKFRRWNDELLQQMNEDLASPWEAVETRIVQHLDAVDEALRQAVASVRHEIRAENQASQTFISFIRLKERELKYLVANERATLLEKFRAIHYDATNDHPSSYILRTMTPIYRACALQCGTGMMAHMHGIMAEKMRRRDIFVYMYDQVKNEMSKAYDEATDAITENVVGMCADVQRQVDMVRGAGSEAARVRPEDLIRVGEMLERAERRLGELEVQVAPATREARDLGWIE